MVHNGIEYGLMAAYAEGLNILQQRRTSGKREHAADAETTPLRDPEHYQYDFDLADIAEVWRRGSVIASWLLDLTADALSRRPRAARVRGPGLGFGRRALDDQAAIDEGVPAHVLSAALFERFASRGEAEFANKILSAMRFQFGGHDEKKAQRRGASSVGRTNAKSRMRSSSSGPRATSRTNRSSPRSSRWRGAAASTCRSSAWRSRAGTSTS